jgi:hypothetical protein
MTIEIIRESSGIFPDCGRSQSRQTVKCGHGSRGARNQESLLAWASSNLAVRQDNLSLSLSQEAVECMFMGRRDGENAVNCMIGH